MERLWALGEERGQLGRAGRERERQKKRKSNLSTPSLIFIQAWESSFASRASTPPLSFFLFLCYPFLLLLPLLLPIPFHFFSPPSPHNSPPLISQLHTTAEQQERRKKKKKKPSWSSFKEITAIKRYIHPKALWGAFDDSPCISGPILGIFTCLNQKSIDSLQTVRNSAARLFNQNRETWSHRSCFNLFTLAPSMF